MPQKQFGLVNIMTPEPAQDAKCDDCHQTWADHEPALAEDGHTLIFACPPKPDPIDLFGQFVNERKKEVQAEVQMIKGKPYLVLYFPAPTTEIADKVFNILTKE